jgi:hypothetical protein
MAHAVWHCRKARFTFFLSALFLGAETVSSETLRQLLAARNPPRSHKEAS